MKSSPFIAVAEPNVTTPTEAESKPSLIFLSNYPVWVKATVSWWNGWFCLKAGGRIAVGIPFLWKGSKRWRFDVSDPILFLVGWILCRVENDLKSKTSKIIVVFCLVVVVVAKGADSFGEDFIQSKCRLL